jgi:hypothetical protein
MVVAAPRSEAVDGGRHPPWPATGRSTSCRPAPSSGSPRERVPELSNHRGQVRSDTRIGPTRSTGRPQQCHELAVAGRVSRPCRSLATLPAITHTVGSSTPCGPRSSTMLISGKASVGARTPGLARDGEPIEASSSARPVPTAPSPASPSGDLTPNVLSGHVHLAA